MYKSCIKVDEDEVILHTPKLYTGKDMEYSKKKSHSKTINKKNIIFNEVVSESTLNEIVDALSLIDNKFYLFGPIINYTKSEFIYFKIRCNHNKYFKLENIPTSCIKMTKYGSIITVCKNDHNSQMIKFINYFKNLDDIMKNSKDELFKNNKKHIKGHPDLFLYQPLIKENKNDWVIIFKYIMSNDYQITTNFVTIKEPVEEPMKMVDKAYYKEDYNNMNKYDLATIVFKLTSKISRDGTHGIRNYGTVISLTQVLFHDVNKEKELPKNIHHDNSIIYGITL